MRAGEETEPRGQVGARGEEGVSKGLGEAQGRGWGSTGLGRVSVPAAAGGVPLGRQEALPGADILRGGGEGRHLGDSVGSEVPKKLSVFLRMNE